MSNRLFASLLLAVLLCSSFCNLVAAADAPQVASPAISLQVKSIDHLIESARATVKKFFPEAADEDLNRAIQGLQIDQFKGIDRTRAIGANVTISSGVLSGDFSKSLAVILLPVADQKAFIEENNFPAKLEKDGDVYRASIGNQFHACLRFKSGYAVIGISSAKVDQASLPEPRDVIDATEAAAAILRVRFDRLPDDLKSLFLGGFTASLETQLQAMKKNGPGPDAPINADLIRSQMAQAVMRWGMRWMKQFVNDVDELKIRLDLDPNSGVLSTELILEPKRGSDMAKSIRDMPASKNRFASIVGTDSAVNFLFQTPLYIDDLRDLLTSLTDWVADGVRQDLKNAHKEQMEANDRLFKALRQTVSAGKLDFAVSVRGPDKNGYFTVVGGVTLKDAAALDKSLHDVVSSEPKMAASLKLDAFKVGEIAVHEMVFGDSIPPDVQKVFGKSPVLVALAPDAVFATFGPAGKDIVTAALMNKSAPQASPLLQIGVGAPRLAILAKNTNAPADAMVFFNKLASAQPVSTALAFSVEGGEKLTVRLDIGLASAWLLMPKAAQADAPPAKPGKP